MTNDNYLILFGDLVGSTEVASEASAVLFSKLYIASFRLAIDCAEHYIKNPDMKKPVFKTVKFSKTIEGIITTGDEVLSFTKMSGLPEKEKNDLIASAVAFALVLKVFWMASPYNLIRLNEKKFPRDIAIGIHSGPAERIYNGDDNDIAGLHINVAKRLETLARNGEASRIFVSDDVAFIFEKWLQGWQHLEIEKMPPLLFTSFKRVKASLDLKGIPVKVFPFELRMNLFLPKLDYLFKLIYGTPKISDAEAENAAMILGDTLLKKLFKVSSLMRQLKDIDTHEKYIDHWFNSIDPLPHLFIHDLWTEMLTFFFSCGFVRNTKLNNTTRNEYKKRTAVHLDKLIDLINRKKTEWNPKHLKLWLPES